jgi:pre-mRNA cleavage complex 2 protein Pcf11
LSYAAVQQAVTGAVAFLYERLPLQCKTCGIRFDDSESGKKAFDFHLDCHFRKARKQTEQVRKLLSRNWFIPEQDWILLSSFDTTNLASEKDSTSFLEDESDSKPLEDSLPAEIVTVASVHNKACPVCQEEFESKWSPSEDDWIFLGAVTRNGQVLACIFDYMYDWFFIGDSCILCR